MKNKIPSLFEFRCWLNHKFNIGQLNNISEIEHLMDIFENRKRNEQIKQDAEDKEKDDICLKCGFMQSHHTESIRKRNKREGESYPCTKKFTKDKQEVKEK